jgi:fibronectin-binding autotransporter adhesin
MKNATNSRVAARLRALASIVFVTAGITGSASAALVTWTGATNKNWDDSATDVNWVDASSNPTVFTNGSAALFNDNAGGSGASYIVTILPTTGVGAISGVAPASVDFGHVGGGTAAMGSYQLNDGTGATSGITGAASVTLDSGYTGTVTYNGANSYSGGTFVNSGTLHAGSTFLPATSTVTLGGGIFQTTSSSSSSTYSASQNFVVAAGTTTGGISWGGTGANPIFNGVFTSSAGATVANTVLNFLSTGTELVNGINFSNAATATPTASFTGTVEYGSTGAGTMRLITGSPNVLVDLGTATGTFPVVTLLTNQKNATLYLGGLKGGVNTELTASSASSAGTITYVIGGAGQTTTFDGLIAGNANGRVGLQIAGGALTLTNANTYQTTSSLTTASTTLNGGSLFANNATGSATGPTPVVINAATLGGNGIVAGLVTVSTAASYAAGGHVSPGIAGTAGPVATISLTGGLTLNDFSNIDYTLNGASTVTGNDLVSTTNLTTTNSLTQVNFSFASIGSLVPGTTYDLINYSGALTGDPTTWTATGVPTGYTAVFSDTAASGGQVNVTFNTVPEPTSMAFVCLATGMTLLRRKRRV